MKKRLPGCARNLLMGITSFALMGCATTQAPHADKPTPRSKATAAAPAPAPEEESDSFDTRIAKLRLGMTKSQVVALMDDDGQSGGKSISAQGTIETLFFRPNFGQRYATSLKREFSLGWAGRSDPNGAVLMFKDGRLTNISTH